MSHCDCPTPGKKVFKTKREAFEYHRKKKYHSIRIYECKCGGYHGTKQKNQNW